MIIHEDEGYYFDRIRIISWFSKWTLEKQLPLKTMREYCKSLDIVKFNNLAVKRRKIKKSDAIKEIKVGYRSKIEIIAPTAEFLRLLSENEADLGRAYKISYMEIAHDVFCESAGDAEFKADILFDNLRKKYSFGCVYEKLNITKKERLKNRSRGLFAWRTYYSSFGKKEEGGKRDRFIYVIYARRSKMNNRYCTHREWRFTGSDMIRKKAHIMTVKDLPFFDIEKYFKENEDKYLVKEQINFLALGIWLKEYDGRRALTKKQNINIQLAARHYVVFRINTFSDLVLHFKSEKESIKKKRGERSEWDKKIMALRSYERFRDVQHE